MSATVLAHRAEDTQQLYRIESDKTLDLAFPR